MKDKLIYLVLGGVILWNLLLSLPKKEESNDINFQMLQQIHQENQRRFHRYELQIKSLQDEIDQDSIIVYSASRDERDSLRSIYNPR